MSEGKNNLEMFVGERIRAQRVRMGISVTQLARATRCPVDEVEEYEMGRKRTPPDRLLDFARELNMPLMYFFYGLANWEPPKWATATKGTGLTRAG